MEDAKCRDLILLGRIPCSAGEATRMLKCSDAKDLGVSAKLAKLVWGIEDQTGPSIGLKKT